MPTKTYFNLQEEKRKMIEKAIIKEYSTTRYYDISVKSIILNAKIPRGSFYQYFEDKDDVIHYAFELIQKDYDSKNDNHIILKNEEYKINAEALVEDILEYRKNIILFENVSTLIQGICLGSNKSSNENHNINNLKNCECKHYIIHKKSELDYSKEILGKIQKTDSNIDVEKTMESLLENGEILHQMIWSFIGTKVKNFSSKEQLLRECNKFVELIKIDLIIKKKKMKGK